MSVEITIVCCQHVTRKVGDDIVLEGSNASAEGGDEGTEEATESGVDLILNHRLSETGFGKKADYMTYLKDYMKKVVKYLEDNNKADQVDEFKKNINGVMKALLGKFNDLQFFTGLFLSSTAASKGTDGQFSKEIHGGGYWFITQLLGTVDKYFLAVASDCIFITNSNITN